MKTLEQLDRMLANGFLTADEYEKKREAYEERLYELFLMGKITEEELLERLDK